MTAWCQSRQKFMTLATKFVDYHTEIKHFFFSLTSYIKLMLRLSAPKRMTRTRPYKVHDARCRSHRNKALFCLLKGSYCSLISEKCIPGSGAPLMKCRGSYGDLGGTNSTSLSIGSLIVITGRGPFLHYRKQPRKTLDKNSFENVLQCKKETHCLTAFSVALFSGLRPDNMMLRRQHL